MQLNQLNITQNLQKKCPEIEKKNYPEFFI